jgi:CheY-like chemotaxis protein
VSDGSVPIRILAVDDHVLVRQGVAVLISTEPDLKLVAEASNGREAIQQFRSHRPDVTLMDLQMPEMNGLDAINAIRGEFADAKIIVLTTYKGDVQILRALKAGGASVPAEEYLAQGTGHRHPSRTCGAKSACSRSLVRNRRARDGRCTDAGGNRSTALNRCGKCEQTDCRPTFGYRRNSEGTSEEHPVETGRQ